MNQKTVVVVLHEQVDMFNGGYYIDHYTCGNCGAEPWEYEEDITKFCPECGAEIKEGGFVHSRY